MCTNLGTQSICTDKRVETPPQGCVWFDKDKHELICSNEKLLGYQMISPKEYSKLLSEVEEIYKEKLQLERDADNCF